MKIQLSFMYTPYTLDTYQTFTSDSFEEHELESLSEEHGREISYDDIDWTYDHEKLVEMLYDNAIDLLQKNIIDDVILAVEKDGAPWSPREYNFSTDDGNIIFTVNHEKLVQFCQNDSDYHKDKIQSVSGFMWLGNDDQTMLNYYLAKKTASEYTPDDYYSDQIDMLDGNGGWDDVISYELKK